MKTDSRFEGIRNAEHGRQAHVSPIREFGPYANRADAHGGYFVVGEWEFHWFEDEGMRGERPTWMKTRAEALRIAVAASHTMHTGARPC